MAHRNQVYQPVESAGEHSFVRWPHNEHGSGVDGEEHERCRERRHADIQLYPCPGVDHGEDTADQDREDRGDGVQQREPRYFVVSVLVCLERDEKWQAGEILEDCIRC